MKIIGILIVFMCANVFAESYKIGQRDYIFEDTTRNRKLATHVWYPADVNSEEKATVQKWNPFVPVSAAKDAAFSKNTDRFPVVLLSHGSGGKADKLFWLTQKLVRNGFIVLGVDHQGNMTGDNTADGMMRVWERPKDLSFALDKVAEQAEFKNHLDLSKVVAAGHSAGGTTVLLLAGARFMAGHLMNPIPNCEGTKDPYLAKLCTEMKGIDISSYPKEVVEGNYSDSRVKAVIGLDPGFADSFSESSLKKTTAKPLVIIAEKINTKYDEIHSKEFLRLLPAGAAEVAPGSYHMSFLMACKKDYPKDDPELRELCIGNDKKIKIQNAIAEKAVKFFRKAL